MLFRSDALAAQVGGIGIAPGANLSDSIAMFEATHGATGQNLANGLIVAVDSSRHIRVFAGGGGSTNFIIDVACYFL